jgi:type II secretory ATPase GspE/PulE/Tfp pilus assembly ATPase PilB-like protein
VTFTPAGDDDEARQANLKMVKPSPGYVTVSALIAEAIVKRSEVTVLDYTASQVAIRYQIDGLWHAGEPMDRETGDYLLATLKQIAGMDYRERRARQTGSFSTEYQKSKQKVRVVSQGVKTGERVAVYLTWKKELLEKVEELGMRASMRTKLIEVLRRDDSHLLLASAKPGEGYTSAWRGVLSACDRLTRDFFVIEDESMVEQEVINFKSITFDKGKGETAMSPLPQLLLKEPNVLAFNDIPDGESLNDMMGISSQHDMPIFVRGPGRNCIDAMLRVLALKPDVEKFASLLTLVVCMRRLRKLCQHCKVPYQPRPDLLQKLGLPAGRITELFRPFVYRQGMVDEDEQEIEPCKHCGGIGYAGLTGIFEMLEVNEKIKKAMLRKPTSDTLKAISRKSRQVTMRQEGALLIAQGVTSVEELQRVLSQK